MSLPGQPRFERTGFLSVSSVEYAGVLPDENLVSFAEQATGMKFGSILRGYLFMYGYLARGATELYGLTGNQAEHSDLIAQTRALELGGKYVAIQNLGDGMYELVDRYDNLFLYDMDSRKITPEHFTLRDRISSILKD